MINQIIPMPIFYSSHGGGHVSFAVSAIIISCGVWIFYASTVIVNLYFDGYDTKKDFLKDLIIPFRLWILSIANKLKSLK